MTIVCEEISSRNEEGKPHLGGGNKAFEGEKIMCQNVKKSSFGVSDPFAERVKASQVLGPVMPAI